MRQTAGVGLDLTCCQAIAGALALTAMTDCSARWHECLALELARVFGYKDLKGRTVHEGDGGEQVVLHLQVQAASEEVADGAAPVGRSQYLRRRALLWTLRLTAYSLYTVVADVTDDPRCSNTAPAVEAAGPLDCEV